MKAVGHDPHPEEADTYEHAAPLEADVDIEELEPQEAAAEWLEANKDVWQGWIN
jgi:ABC-type proline/glycine betaine transport system substrate-binding protein